MSNLSSDKIKEWLAAHEVVVVDNNKRIHRTISDLDFFKYRDYNIVDSMPRIQMERAFVLQIPESQLERIIRFEQQVFGNQTGHKHHYNLFEALMIQKEEEQKLRNSNEAVKKAYEHYSLMLQMAKTNNL